MRPGDAERLRLELERAWSQEGDALACLSVRSGWDLFLTSQNWPRGGEVLMSALTIPDMAGIVRHHGLVPVPLDVGADTLAPSAGAIEAAVTPRTRAVLIAHLFGTHADLTPLIGVARSRNLLFVEDCAQAWTGPESTGHPDADVSMFSFGPIKTATALGGALLRVRNAERLEAMRQRQANFPLQRRRRFFARLCKYAGLKALSGRLPFGLFTTICRWVGVDVTALVGGMVRGFAAAGIERFRHQPSAPLLRLLRHRLTRWSESRLTRRAELGAQLRDRIGDAATIPGDAAGRNDYWVFPILAADPQAVIQRLRMHSFDASRAHSMSVVDPPEDRPETEPHTARRLLRELVFLPMYPELTERAIDRLAETVRSVPTCGTP